MFDFLSEKFSTIFSRLTGQGHFSEKNINETLLKIKEALLEADIPYQVVEDFLQEVLEQVKGQKVFNSLKPSEHFIKIVHDKLVAFLGGTTAPFSFQLPSVVMVMGLQGSGKTTTIAKLVHSIQQQALTRGKKRSILIASVDFYRPAAIDQLEILSKQVDCSFYRSSLNNPVQAAEDIHRYYKTHGFELLLLDTAGRLHVDDSMLAELQKIDHKLEPRYKLLVLDAMTGQESLHIAQAFDEKVGFYGSILTKLDSDTRAGAAFAFRYMLKKPLLYVGTGEKLADLELFRPDRMANRILGMGDLQTLLERAEEKIKKSEQETLQKSFMQGKMNLNDFAQQLDMMSKMGSISQLVKYIPGMAGARISPEMLEKGEREVRRFKAIISSMTPKERIYPKILDSSRKQRIAKGAGVTVSEINVLLDRLEQSQQFVKMFKKLGKMPGM